MLVNAFQQPIGAPLPHWTARPVPPHTPLNGHFCRIEPVDVDRHVDGLYRAYSTAPDGRDWTYMSAGPFADAESFRSHLIKAAASRDPLHYTIIDLATHEPTGMLALMRIDSGNGVIEIGHVAYSPLIRRTSAATEAMFLLLRHVFDDLGYRRCEWKCDHLNAPSRAAALRYGFQYEGIFRQAVVYKGRSRDTAWFAMIDRDWPAIRMAFERWLAPENFDAAGVQRVTLANLIAAQCSGTESSFRRTPESSQE
ncbi:acetyltransferase [Dyella nitratireducens]|uniref:Acetyltransferase n=2 Tax=Dyella nitratireducens TaxID=1849580 RepID=A0ABQ1GIF6_9GAMM|nr:acetyltransferase [Dyella nitratireducens]GLQ41729.1 acetyltransferase [Dyella nitratireducens]